MSEGVDGMPTATKHHTSDTTIQTPENNKEEEQHKPEITRQYIENIVKDFFRNPTERPDYVRDDVDLEDPYCTLDDDFTYDDIGRVEFFTYLAKQFNYEFSDKFMTKVQRLKQIYDYLERVLIKEKDIPKKPRKPRVNPPPRTCFLFPGQGSQKVGMASMFAVSNENNNIEKYPEAKKLFDKASEILGYDLLKYCVEGLYVQCNVYVCVFIL